VRRLRPRRALELARSSPGAAADMSRSQLGRLLLGWGVIPSLPHGFHRVARRVRPPARYGATWLTESAARALVDSEDPWAWKRRTGVPRWWAQLLDSMTAFRERFGIQEYVRLRAASAGIAARSPFLDPDLVERMLRVPPEIAFRSILNRPVLREAVRGISPDVVRLRPEKADFNAFYRRGVVGPNLAPVTALLSEPGAPVKRFVKSGALAQLLERQPAVGEAGWASTAVGLWRIANIELWLRLQSDPAFPMRFLESARFARSEMRFVQLERR
jgi:asparagine synthase